MRRFQFSMDRVLNLRKQQQRWMELQLSRHGAALADARHKLEALIQQLNQLGDALEAEVRDAASGVFAINPFAYRKQLSAQMDLARQQLSEETRRYEETLAEHVALTQNVEMLETLRSNQQRDHKRQQQKKEQRRLDALIATRWTEGRRIKEVNSDG